MTELDPATRTLLDATGVTWELWPSEPLDRIDIDGSQGFQVRRDGVNREVVDRYVAAMENGDVFPPLIVARLDDDTRIVLGGNHRYHAANKANLDEFDQIIVEAPTPAQCARIAFGDNANHGVPTTELERIDHVLWLCDNDGMTRAEACRLVGISTAKVARELETRNARDRAKSLGVAPNMMSVLKATTIWRAAALSDDTVFVAYLEAVATWGIASKVAFELVSSLNRLDTVEEQLDRIEQTIETQMMSSGSSRSGHRSVLDNLTNALFAVGDMKVEDFVKAANPGDFEIWDRRLKDGAKKLFALAQAAPRRPQ